MRHLRIHGQMDSNHVVAYGVYRLARFNEAMNTDAFGKRQEYAQALEQLQLLQQTLEDATAWLVSVTKQAR